MEVLRHAGSMKLLFGWASLALVACHQDPAPMTVPTTQDVPVPPATAIPPEPASAQPPPLAPPAGKRAACASDQSCNDDESASGLWGKCTALGTCECAAGFELNPRGRCQKAVK
jgi:hypothetical protein